MPLDDIQPKTAPAENANSAATARVYDAVPYPRLAHQNTHPSHVAALATLLRFETRPPEQWRVLELGCASGSNILPMAVTLPGAHFVGIDLSPRQIEMGRADAAALALQNVELHTLDLLDLVQEPTRFGEFDYIVAHGLYSWVPAEVRPAILKIIRASLAPTGLAFISYNAFPGWHAMEALRHVMLYHIRHVEEPAQGAVAARALLDLLAENLAPEKSIYGAHIRAFRDYLLKDEDQTPDERNSYLLHDHLAHFNQPFYIHEFIAQVEEAGLSYVSDTDLVVDLPVGIPSESRGKLEGFVHNRVDMLQYVDFFANRLFRRSLISLPGPELGRILDPRRVRSLWFSSPAVPDRPEMDFGRGVVEKFATRQGISISLDHPLTKAAFWLLVKQWPRLFQFDELWREARTFLQERNGGVAVEVSDGDLVHLSANLVQAHMSSSDLIELFGCPAAHADGVEPLPVGSRWARLEVLHSPTVTNLRHERVHLEPLEAEILRLLDGTRDVAALAELLAPPVLAGDIVFTREDAPVHDREEAIAMLPSSIVARLETLARAALLERSA